MAYTTLYRKFRPQVFEDVYGQDHVVTALRNQIISDRIGHAYIFSGTRGTGKTTIAKIFAKAINCEHPNNGSPCGTCDSCRQIADNSALNVIEIDGASNNGINNIRDIIEEVSYPPVNGKYKVYIIDEAHAVTKDAFNALLKTLEEPPSYVVFILATTESGQLLNTIRSRCQQYDFHRIGISMIEERLSHVISSEGYKAQEKAIRYMARLADGSLRDGISLLDQCIAFSEGDTLEYDKVLNILGAVDTAVFSKLVRSIHDTNVVESLRVVDEIITEGREPTVFALDFVWYLRNLLLVKSGEDLENILDISTENQKLLVQEAELISENTLIRYIRVLSEAIAQLRYSSVKRVTLEVAIVQLCRPQMEENIDSLIQRVELLERGALTLEPQQAAYTEPITANPVSPKDNSASLPKEEQILSSPPMEDVPNGMGDSTIPAYWKEVTFDDPTISLGLDSASICFLTDTQIEITFNINDPMQSILLMDLKEKKTFDAFRQAIEQAAGASVEIQLKEEKQAVEPTISKVSKTEDKLERIEQIFGTTVETEDF